LPQVAACAAVASPRQSAAAETIRKNKKAP
jgi:hypothetical protein